MYNIPKPKNRWDDEKLPPNCEIRFGLPKSFTFNFQDYPKGEVLFICRIKVDDGQYTPTNFNTAPRYIFGHAQTHNQTNNDTKLMRSLFSAHRYGQSIGVTNVKLIDMTKEEALQKPKIISEKNITKLQSYRIK
jgi:hypothetical protein